MNPNLQPLAPTWNKLHFQNLIKSDRFYAIWADLPFRSSRWSNQSGICWQKLNKGWLHAKYVIWPRIPLKLMFESESKCHFWVKICITSYRIEKILINLRQMQKMKQFLSRMGIQVINIQSLTQNKNRFLLSKVLFCEISLNNELND